MMWRPRPFYQKFQHKLVAWFIGSAAIILFLAANTKLVTAIQVPALVQRGPLLIEFIREILIILAILELSLSAIILMVESTKLKLVIVASAAITFLAVRLGLQLMHVPNICNSLGYFASELPISPRTLDQSGLVVICWLLAGSCLLLTHQQFRAQKGAGIFIMIGDITDMELVPRQRISKIGRLKRLLWNWGIGMVMSGLLLAGLHTKKQSMLPRNLDKIIKEVYSIQSVRAAPVVNHQGTKLLYVWNAEVGVNISLVDLGTLKRLNIDAVTAADCASPKAFDLFGWSPDDHFLAYCAAIESDLPTRRIVLRDGATGHFKDSFVINGIIQQAIWLSTNSLVLLDSSYGLHLFNLNRDDNLGRFGKKGLLPLQQIQINDLAYALTRISDRSIAYVADGNIWSLEIPSGKTTQLTYLTHDLVEWLDYNPTTSELLTCITPNGAETHRYLFRLGTQDIKTHDCTQVTSNYTYKGLWIQGGTGIAYVGTKGNGNYLGLETKDIASRADLFAGGHIRSYNIAPKGDKVYAVASISCEPLSIWEYDIVNKSLRNVVPGLEHPLTVARMIDPSELLFTNKQGVKRSYYYLHPVGMIAQKQYPAIIDRPSDSRFDNASQFLANAGIFYVSINHFGLASSEMLATASSDILSVREELLKNPNIDPRRIYIAARSASTVNACEIVQKHPGMWRGVILLSPIALPEISTKMTEFPSVFISIGDKENAAAREQCETFAQEACRSLIPAQIILHRSAGHWVEGNELAEDRYKAVAAFVLTRY